MTGSLFYSLYISLTLSAAMRVDAAHTECSQYNDSPLLTQTQTHTYSLNRSPVSVIQQWLQCPVTGASIIAHPGLHRGIRGVPGHRWDSPCQWPCRSPWLLALQTRLLISVVHMRANRVVWSAGARLKRACRCRGKDSYWYLKHTLINQDITRSEWLHSVIHRGAWNFSISWWCQRYVCPSLCLLVILWKSECL